MALNNFFGNGSSAAVVFEIRLDQDIIVLRGSEQEASSALLKGVVVLCITEPLTIKNVFLELTGTSKLAFPGDLNSRGSRSRYFKHESSFQYKKFPCTKFENKTHTLKPGNYEYPFEAVIQGDWPESVEGLEESWVVYKLKATVERRLAHDLHSRKHLRVIRTLDPSALELAHAMSVENVWPNKVEYSLSTPNKAVIFGTSVHIDIHLTPLLKALKIGRVRIKLTESQEYSAQDRSHKASRDVAIDEYQVEEGSETIDSDGQEGYNISRLIQLPRTLRECVQDVDCKGLKIRHKLKFNIQLLNPDGHVSELRAMLPISIFISPNLPIDEFNNLIDRGPLNAQDMEIIEQHAPPLYGEHQFDQLYSDIDPSGYMTPTTGLNTPLRSRSRNASIENLSSLSAIAEDAVPHQLLQSRLHNLSEPSHGRWLPGRTQISPHGSNAPTMTLSDNAVEGDSAMRPHSIPTPESYFPDSHDSNSRPSTSNPLSRHHSGEDGNSSHSSQTPQPAEIDAAILSKVPSYSTARRAPHIVPYSEDLPDYATATSRPPSPQMSLPQTPGPVHVHGSTTDINSAYSSTSTIPRSRLLPNPNTLQDEDRRLRLMQLRGGGGR
ncbi:MAG: hypothetical protein M1827_007688 [Pycnora praestabilis]|nr:MAG: hypothetical protein M1827_007688 [Pycnora praestabilis]